MAAVQMEAADSLAPRPTVRSGSATACWGEVYSVLHVQTVYPVVCASRALPLPAMAFYEPNDESGSPYAGASVLPAATVRRCRRPPERAHGVFKKAA